MNGFFGAVQSHWANEQYSSVQSTRAWPDFSLVSVRASRFQSSPVQSRNLQTAPQLQWPLTSPITVNFSQNRSYTDETDRVLSECRSFEWYFDTWSVSFKACKLIRYIIRSKSDIWVLTSLRQSFSKSSLWSTFGRTILQPRSVIQVSSSVSV